MTISVSKTPESATPQRPPPPESSHDVVSICGRRIEFRLEQKPYNPVRRSSNFRIETLNPSSSSSSGSETLLLRDWNDGGLVSRKSDGVDLLENGLDPLFTSPITFRRIGAGLANLGNTCFLNSVLQCLTYTEPLAAYLQSGKHKNSCRTIGFCALCAIQRHVSNALQATGRILVPKDLVSNLRCISRNFRNARQEDAHEYMIHLLESMHKCCLPSGVSTESPTAYEKSLVHKIFGGRLRSRVKCLQCSFCSDKFDPFLDLSLEIVKVDSLQKALHHFTAAEKLDDGEKQYHCEKCKQKVKALKQLTVDKAPYVLTIHLKRFGYFSGQKIDRKVHFGPTINMKPFVNGSYGDGDLRYTLYGVLVHAGGSTHSGHYYCFVRTSSGMWYSLDDNKVFQVSERTVLDQKAYMLFYVRDRNHFSNKKPLNIVQKANGIATTVKNVSTADSSCKAIQNGFTEKHPNGLLTKHWATAIAPGVTVQNKASDVGPSQSFHKDESVPNGNGVVVSEDTAMRNDKTLVSESTVEDIGQPMERNENNSGTSDLKVAPVTNAKVCSEDKSSSTNPEAVARLSNLNSALDIAVNEDCKEPQKMDSDAQAGIFRAPKSEQCDLLAGKKDSNHQSNEMHAERANHKVESSPIDPSVSVESTKLPGVEGSATAGSSAHVSGEKLKKRKKFRGPTMHFGPSMIYRASFGIHKKKKGKKKKARDKSLAVERVLDTSCISVESGPSTSDRSNSVSLGKSVHSVSGTDFSSRTDDVGTAEKRVRDFGENVRSENFGKKLKERKDQSNARFGTSSTSERNQLDDGNLHSLKDRLNCQGQNGKASIAALGLETTVGRWDEEGLASPKNLDSNGSEGRSIGYVGDDWDGDYDKGKRKKLKRSMFSFGGPNLFQEMAAKKAKLKIERKR